MQTVQTRSMRRLRDCRSSGQGCPRRKAVAVNDSMQEGYRCRLMAPVEGSVDPRGAALGQPARSVLSPRRARMSPRSQRPSRRSGQQDGERERAFSRPRRRAAGAAADGLADDARLAGAGGSRSRHARLVGIACGACVGIDAAGARRRPRWETGQDGIRADCHPQHVGTIHPRAFLVHCRSLLSASRPDPSASL